MPDTHMMVDIETLGLAHDAAIVSIGAVIFDPRGQDTEETLTDTYYARISLESNELYGRSIDAGTIIWWFKQSDSVRYEAIGANTNLKDALFQFRKWFQDRRIRPTRIWACDPDFDLIKIKSAMRATKELWPYDFHVERSVRTIQELAYPEGDKPVIGVGDAHNAIDDAVRQALLVQHCYGILKA